MFSGTSMFSPFNFSEAPANQKRNLPWNCYVDERDICRPAREAGGVDEFVSLSLHLAAWIPKQCACLEEERAARVEKYSRVDKLLNKMRREGERMGRRHTGSHGSLALKQTGSSLPPSPKVLPVFWKEPSQNGDTALYQEHKAEQQNWS